MAHCVALSKVFNHSECRKLQIVHFENCCISDSEFSKLLEGLANVEQLRNLTYKTNDFGPKSLEAIKPLLYKNFPNNLRELKLIKCTISQQSIIEDLLEYLREEQCNLQSLGLIAARLSEQALLTLNQVIAGTATLFELDISWNDLRASAYKEFLIGLSVNKSLRMINLSWNNLVDYGEQALEGNFDVKSVNLATESIKDLISKQKKLADSDGYQ